MCVCVPACPDQLSPTPFAFLPSPLPGSSVFRKKYQESGSSLLRRIVLFRGQWVLQFRRSPV
eukprot:7888567-Alexandrium_andersonii.AAC.1